MEENQPLITGDWKTETNKVIAKNLMDNVAKLTNGNWYRTETLNSRGERTTRYIVEFAPSEYSDVNSDVSGND
jgi:hypothetical protein